MLKLPPANYLALTDTLYTALNNVRAYLFRFSANSLPQIVLNLSFSQKNCYVRCQFFFIDRLASTTAYQKNKKKNGGLSFKKIIDDVTIRR
jgi:hypothetical protein